MKTFRIAVGLVALVLSIGAAPEALALTITPNPAVVERRDLQGDLIRRSRFEVIEIVRGVPQGGELLIGRVSEDSYSVVLRYSVEAGRFGATQVEVGNVGKTGGGWIPGDGIDIVSVTIPLILPGIPTDPVFFFNPAETIQPGQRTDRFFVVFDDLAPGDEILAEGQVLNVVPEPSLASLVCTAGLLGWTQRRRR